MLISFEVDIGRGLRRVLHGRRQLQHDTRYPVQADILKWLIEESTRDQHKHGFRGQRKKSLTA